MASVPVYCLCGQPYDVTRFMIQCDGCKEWFHGSCVDLREHQSNDIEKYHCPKCTKIFGPSLFKQRTNWHRHDYTEIEADSKAVQTGTPVFIKELKSRHFPSADDVVQKLRGQQLTHQYFLLNGFQFPILVERKDGLGLTVPPESFTVEDVESNIGSDREVDVIDVGRQDDIRMTMREFVEYFNSPNRIKILNLISLEFSKTKLAELVESPFVVRKLSWVNNVWPDHLPPDCPYDKPEVQKYCLIGMKDSYTDFHIDFGGTSVWYHVLKGEKVFYIICPTSANLSLYEQWMSSSNQSETFFGDQVDACYRCVVKQGQTLFIPTGWIHAVFTPIDSLVFGGNFLHDLNVPLQLQVNELERRIKTPEKFRFPSFEAINWYATKHIVNQLKEFNDGDLKPSMYLVQAAKALLVALKSWTQNKDLLKSHAAEIPENVQHVKLIKDLNKEFRHAEKVVSNKPREDKRKRKRPNDSVDPLMGDLDDLDSIEENKDFVSPLRLNISRTLSMGQASDDPATEAKNNLTPLKLTLPRNNIQEVKSPPPVQPATKQPSSPFKLWIAKGIQDSKSNVLKMKLPKAPRRRKEAVAGANEKQLLNVKNTTNSTKIEPPISPDKDTSIYEFRDSDDEGLVVDENPPAKLKRLSANKPKRLDGEKQGLLKLRLSFNSKPVSVKEEISDHQKDQPSVETSDVDVMSFSKNSGIDELLRASGYTTETESKLEEALGNGRASPSTREAIQGMLSIGCAVQFSTLTTSTTNQMSRSNNSIGNGSSQHRPQRQRKFILSDDIGENMSKCHQDDEYIYPTLDASDDEIHIFKPRGRVKRDEPWNPKAKLLPNCPKPDRPVREGMRKESVENGLAAAAAKLANLPPPKRQYYRKKPSHPKPPPKQEQIEAGPSTSTGFSLKRPGALDLGNKFSAKKPRKGMATAKQRLGKILKIHKMLY